MKRYVKNSLWIRLVFYFLVLTISGRCIKKTTSNEIFKDDFNRDNSSSTLGSNWTLSLPAGTTFTINNSMAKPLGSNATTEAALPSALYNKKVTGSFKVSAKFTISGIADYDSMGYLIARSAAMDIPTDAYLCGYYFDTTTVAPNKKYYFTLRKIASNVSYEIAKVAMHQLTSGKSDTITFTIDNTTLKCEISGNSTVSITTTDSSFGDGYAGIMGGGNNTPYLFFDDFLIEKL